jgi:hypothetical protein
MYGVSDRFRCRYHLHDFSSGMDNGICYVMYEQYLNKAGFDLIGDLCITACLDMA